MDHKYLFTSKENKDRFVHDYGTALDLVACEYRSPMRLMSKLKSKFIETIVLESGALTLYDHKKYISANEDLHK